jgi:hypothetical protein
VQEIPPVVTNSEAMSILRIKSEASLYKLFASGKLRRIIIGQKPNVSGQSIAELLRESEQQTYAPTRESPNTREKREKAAT